MTVEEWVRRFIKRVEDKVELPEKWTALLVTTDPELAGDELMDQWEKEGLHLRDKFCIAFVSTPSAE